jgi:hypothetical protein
MRKRYGLTFEDQTLAETAEERTMKRSVELLRIKELQLPSPIERPSAESTRPLPPAIPSPIVIPASPEGPTSPTPLLASPLLSPAMPQTERSRKTQSAYAPITTKEKSKASEESNECLGPKSKRKGDWYMYKIKLRLKDIFKKDKA